MASAGKINHFRPRSSKFKRVCIVSRSSPGTYGIDVCSHQYRPVLHQMTSVHNRSRTREFKTTANDSQVQCWSKVVALSTNKTATSRKSWNFYSSFNSNSEDNQCMRTRSSSNLVGESSPNPTTSNPKRRNHRRSKQPFSLKESLVDTMANQRTMAELLHASIEGYA
ncbi:hypothetical protein Tco_1502915 [Tanacetum coccineum]